MELYAQYLKEREGVELLTKPEGFAVYSQQPDGNFYIRDIFVASDFRKTGIAKTMADEICDTAKRCGAKKIYGSVAPTANGATESMKVLLAYGMRLQGFNAALGLIVFEKDL